MICWTGKSDLSGNPNWASGTKGGLRDVTKAKQRVMEAEEGCGMDAETGASRSGDGAREDEAEHGLVRVADTRVGQAGGVTGSEQSDKLAD